MAAPSQAVFSLKTRARVDVPEDDDMVDESTLLEDEDKERKVVTDAVILGDCSTRRKACKNCSCGRAELEKQAEITGAAAAMPAMPSGGCGNCSRGDAFRCAGCPFLGKPNWKPGEKVELANLDDDI
eukprot:NODE_9306_length_650_cov_100.912713_g9040_i0.p2 GENE.NODE_9306_length_650_cov_100.912713_g9040_i0~~NODE_9306_length_650_cov_100.912713_g9040_i0.p2  ORF type:complete len:127 (-),score=40.80 NODE_9306_length_650_cov_100.912713_g9040_i0:215-595(-)